MLTAPAGLESGDENGWMKAWPRLPRVLLVTPPMLQFTSPYLASPLLAGFLRTQGVEVFQADLSLEVALSLYSRGGMIGLLKEIRRRHLARRSRPVAAFVAAAKRYLSTVDGVVRFLQTGDEKHAERIRAGWLPAGPRFKVLADLYQGDRSRVFLNSWEYPRLLAGLYLDDIADVLRVVNSRFGLSRYAERLTMTAASLSPFIRRLRAPPDFIEQTMDAVVDRWFDKVKPGIVGITVPFPGCFYGALRVAARIKKRAPHVRIVVGGGFVNTELRDVTDPRLFDYFDFVTYDDGELPLLQIVKHVAGMVPRKSLIRTRLREGRQVIYVGANGPHLRHGNRPTPWYGDLPLSRYCGVVETTNPMARLWTERCWIKLVLAHGCYWHRCAFCDTQLDYIRRYDPADVRTIIRWIQELIKQTGKSDFHFVDEAAPPGLLRRLGQELINRGIRIRWWTNIRFEPAFTPQLVRLLAASGCIAVTGGIECAGERLLRVVNKGISLKDAARVTHAFADAGVLVHAYLMYGLPGQTVQETVDALEFVRQMFQAGCLHSVYWHRFALTVHSRIYAEPWRFGVKVLGESLQRFTRNEVAFSDGSLVDHDRLGEALRKASYNFMHGMGLEEDVRVWFPFRVPKPRIPETTVMNWLG